MESEGGKAGVEMPEVAELLDEWIPKSTWSAAETATAPEHIDNNPLHAPPPPLEDVRTATIYENQRYYKRRLTYGPVRSGQDPVPVFGSGPGGRHFIPWQWSSDPRTDPHAHVVPNVDLSAPWEWVDEEWAKEDHWEYASSFR